MVDGCSAIVLMNKVSGFCVTKFLKSTLKENVGYSVLKIHEDMFSG